MYCLQSRWKLRENVLQYYGLRNKDRLFRNVVKLNKKQLAIVKALPKELTIEEIKTLKSLMGEQIVEQSELRRIPTSWEEARFCKTCIANDFMIPGLEFDGEERCPMCQTQEQTKEFKSVLPIVNRFPKSKKSRFDVALFYTGGKDSTYLLYYLSKVCRLRVLALTWEIPYISPNAKQSIENAKKELDNVEFVTRYVSNADLRKMYSVLYALAGNTCACPSLAYVLFYAELVENKVPYFIAGNEPAQLLGLYYNHMAPPISYCFAQNRFLQFLIGAGRVITLRPPLKKGQFQTLATMKQLAYGDSAWLKLSGYRNELLSNVVQAIHSVEHLVKPLKRAIRRSSATGNIPAFVQVDLNEICGGKYDWKAIKSTIEQECGWVGAADKGLHTSCCIEKCKEHSQFIRFYNMESTMIPFSALEISLASRNNVSREDAVREMKQDLGFSLTPVAECAIMKEYLDGE